MEGISSKAGGHPFPPSPIGQAGNQVGMQGLTGSPLLLVDSYSHNLPWSA
jgi:hypothetical protein